MPVKGTRGGMLTTRTNSVMQLALAERHRKMCESYTSRAKDDGNKSKFDLNGFTAGLISSAVSNIADPTGAITNLIKSTIGVDISGESYVYESRSTFYAGKITGDVASILIGYYETVNGISTIIAGIGGTAGGAAATATGAGAVVGVPVAAVSLELIAAGVAEAGAGIAALSSGIKNISGDIQNYNSSKKINETVSEFEERISKLSPSERVAAVKEKSSKVAKENGLIKDSKLSRINGRDVYKDPNTGEYYSVDTQHGRFEHLNKRGQHLGEVDFDFNQTKPADTSGQHNIQLN